MVEPRHFRLAHIDIHVGIEGRGHHVRRSAGPAPGASGGGLSAGRRALTSSACGASAPWRVGRGSSRPKAPARRPRSSRLGDAARSSLAARWGRRRGQERIEIERLERERGAEMRSWALQREHRLALAGRMAERKACLREGDLARLPGDMAGQLAAADGGGGRGLLAHPGEDRGHRLRLGGQIAFGAESGLAPRYCRQRWRRWRPC